MGIPGFPYSRDFGDPFVIIGTPFCIACERTAGKFIAGDHDVIRNLKRHCMSIVHVRCPRLMAQEWRSVMPVNYDSTLNVSKTARTRYFSGYAKTAAESTCRPSYFHYFMIVFIYHIVMGIY